MSKTVDNTVYLLIGPRGSGKSNYCKILLSSRQDFSLISRDEILVHHFGSADTCPYSGGHEFANEEVERLLQSKLSTEKGISIVLDTWTEESSERKSLVRRLREYGATRVVALYFVTPVKFVKEWFWKKPKIARIGEMGEKERQGFTFFLDDTPERDYVIFHKLAAEIDSDGFDEVVRVNPLQKTFVF